MLVALSVAVSLAPAALGLYWIVTLHDLFGPRLVALQLSAVFVNAAELDRLMVSAPVAEPPELVSVNVCDAL
ncbi:MAG TPA: hypothetical protein VFT22_40545 [Kofleriaceae bacterium]|nr:hypothetical protein [Kofleriaceae bacterium]